MKFLLTAFLFLFTATGFTATEFMADKETITLDMSLSIDGKLISKPRVISISGKTASITSASDNEDGVFIEVTPTLQNKNEVFMKFVVAKLEKGKKTILGKPQMISTLGKQAEITQEFTNGSHKSMSLVVTATL